MQLFYEVHACYIPFYLFCCCTLSQSYIFVNLQPQILCGQLSPPYINPFYFFGVILGKKKLLLKKLKLSVLSMAFINPGIAILKTWQGIVEIALRAGCAVSTFIDIMLPSVLRKTWL